MTSVLRPFPLLLKHLCFLLYQLLLYLIQLQLKYILFLTLVVDLLFRVKTLGVEFDRSKSLANVGAIISSALEGYVLVVLVAGLGLAQSISCSRGEEASKVLNIRGRVGRVLRCGFGCLRGIYL